MYATESYLFVRAIAVLMRGIGILTRNSQKAIFRFGLGYQNTVLAESAPSIETGSNRMVKWPGSKQDVAER